MPTHRPERGNVPYSDNAAAPENIWTVAEAKSRLPEVLRRASAVGPQQIGVHRPHVVVPLDQWRARTEPDAQFRRGGWSKTPRAVGRSSCRAARTATGRFPSPIRVSRSDPVAGQAGPSHRYATAPVYDRPDTNGLVIAIELKQDAPIADARRHWRSRPFTARHRQSRSRRMRQSRSTPSSERPGPAASDPEAPGPKTRPPRSGSELPLDFFPSKGASGPEVLQSLPEAPERLPRSVLPFPPEG